MIDPLSSAGLAIAVFDQLWKLGERTAELVADFREFDNVSNAPLIRYEFSTMTDPFTPQLGFQEAPKQDQG